MGRLLRDRQALGGEELDELDKAVEKVLAELGGEWDAEP
jgi:hypothetical protein